MEFKTGDVVTLRSGGPLMTVKAVTPSGVECVFWFRQVAEEETFPAEVLKLADDKRS